LLAKQLVFHHIDCWRIACHPDCAGIDLISRGSPVGYAGGSIRGLYRVEHRRRCRCEVEFSSRAHAPPQRFVPCYLLLLQVTAIHRSAMALASKKNLISLLGVAVRPAVSGPRSGLPRMASWPSVPFFVLLFLSAFSIMFSLPGGAVCVRGPRHSRARCRSGDLHSRTDSVRLAG